MTGSKYRMTGFARFLIFLIFFIPVAYIGASYYNGEDGIGKIKKVLNISDKKEKTSSNTNYDCEAILRDKEMEIERLKATIVRMNENQ